MSQSSHGYKWSRVIGMEITSRDWQELNYLIDKRADYGYTVYLDKTFTIQDSRHENLDKREVKSWDK